MTPADLQIIEALAQQCEGMSEQDSPRLTVPDVHALARALRAVMDHVDGLHHRISVARRLLKLEDV